MHTGQVAAGVVVHCAMQDLQLPQLALRLHGELTDLTTSPTNEYKMRDTTLQCTFKGVQTRTSLATTTT